MNLHRGWFAASLAACGLAISLPAVASAQITYNVTYTDVVNSSGFGFNDPANGVTRQNTVNSVFAYLATQLDGRGSASILWNASLNSNSGILGSFGPNGFVGQVGSFQNGAIYNRVRSGASTFGNPDGDGQINFHTSINWNNTTSNPTASQFDLFSVVLHEVLHGHGFLSFTNSAGQGGFGNPVGNPDLYAGYDKFIQRGNTVGVGGLTTTNVANANFGSFTGPVSTLTNGNNATTGLFFGGKYAAELFGGAVPLYAPSTYSSGSSTSHDNTVPAGVMNFNIPNGVRRLLLPYEVGMLIDMGYNNYNWNANTTGSWLGAGTLAASNWRTDMGITRNAANNTSYNINAAQAQAPILPPHGQVTSNIVLNFTGSGATPYTSTNDIGNFRLARITLNSTASVANTITGGTLIWGQNSDASASVLTAAIEQQNTGAFNINSTMQIPNGLTVRGSGTGTITLGGDISGAGGFTKQGSFTAVMSGTNTYTGTTTVSAGTLLVNGTLNGTSNIAVASGATLGGSGTVSVLTPAAGSFVRPGTSPGTLTASTLTMSAGTYIWELAQLSTSTGFDQIVVTTGLTLGGTSAVTLDFAGLTGPQQPSAGSVDPFWNAPHSWKILDWTGGGNPNQNFASLTNGTGYTAGSFSLALGSGADTGDVFLFYSLTSVPEPATMAFCGLALVGTGYTIWRRRRLSRLALDARV